MSSARFAVVALLLAACSTEDTRICFPGRVGYCACPGATTGTQACTEDGMGFAPCSCPAAARMADAGASDAWAAPDGLLDGTQAATADAMPDAQPDTRTAPDGAPVTCGIGTGTACASGVCMFSPSSWPLCVACDAPDTSCAACGSAGQRACDTTIGRFFCRVGLRLAGPYPDGAYLCQ